MEIHIPREKKGKYVKGLWRKKQEENEAYEVQK